jgi:hypothetical protein
MFVPKSLVSKFLAVTVVAGLSFAVAPKTQAQVEISVGIAPACPYGYYEAAPYSCAPAGYYGPNWFVGGAFVGAGPWFHGPSNFHGNVDNRYDPAHGYKGAMPARGEKPNHGYVASNNFKGNEERDGRGHVTQSNHNEKQDNKPEQQEKH